MSAQSFCTEKWCIIAAHPAICQYDGPSVRSHACPSQHCVVNEALCSLTMHAFLLTYPWFSNPSSFFFVFFRDHFCSPPEISLSTYVSSFVCTFPSSFSLLPSVFLGSQMMRCCVWHMRLQPQTTRCRIMYSSINFPFRFFFSVKKTKTKNPHI